MFKHRVVQEKRSVVLVEKVGVIMEGGRGVYTNMFLFLNGYGDRAL
jgi:hypothetical protein